MTEQTELQHLKLYDFCADWYSWKFCEINNEPLSTRIYHDPKGLTEGAGFYFACVRCTGHEIAPDFKGAWEPESCGEFMFAGYAYFDGIRHIYFAEKDGYMNYPKIELIIDALKKLRELELLYCRDPE